MNAKLRLFIKQRNGSKILIAIIPNLEETIQRSGETCFYLTFVWPKTNIAFLKVGFPCFILKISIQIDKSLLGSVPSEFKASPHYQGRNFGKFLWRRKKSDFGLFLSLGPKTINDTTNKSLSPFNRFICVRRFPDCWRRTLQLYFDEYFWWVTEGRL